MAVAGISFMDFGFCGAPRSRHQRCKYRADVQDVLHGWTPVEQSPGPRPGLRFRFWLLGQGSSTRRVEAPSEWIFPAHHPLRRFGAYLRSPAWRAGDHHLLQPDVLGGLLAECFDAGNGSNDIRLKAGPEDRVAAVELWG